MYYLLNALKDYLNNKDNSKHTGTYNNIEEIEIIESKSLNNFTGTHNEKFFKISFKTYMSFNKFK
jgi:hypothetical protein